MRKMREMRIRGNFGPFRMSENPLKWPKVASRMHYDPLISDKSEITLIGPEP